MNYYMTEFIKKIDENGITHYVNTKYEKVFDNTEAVNQTFSVNPLFIPPTAEEIQQHEHNQKRANAKKYLSETDWYVTRQTEIGTPIPEEILIKRSQARIDANN